MGCSRGACLAGETHQFRYTGTAAWVRPDPRPQPAWSFCGFAGSVDFRAFLYFSTLICCLCSHFGFLQFFENDDVAFVYWVLQNTTFAEGPDHRGSLIKIILMYPFIAQITKGIQI
jgi:hypothetical protein